MNKLCAIAVFAVLTGCASSEREPEILVASIVPSDPTAIAQLASNATVVDISDPENRVSTICKPRIVTGSHLIRGVECTTPAADLPELTDQDKFAAAQKESDIRYLQRKQQEALERYQNDQLRRAYVPAR
ncbi:MAG TPA: hypothetical protein VE907_13435 [Gammaproteobacteria bacterium]|nr:hypothetical protein [Gammaproteobacteria bacterium]